MQTKVKITNIQEAQQTLQKHIINSTDHTGDNLSLDRMWPLLDVVGNPHKNLKVIHIAGTSGKTSTAYYVSALLYATGKKVGLTVSPHIDTITERVQIDGKPLNDELFCKELAIFLDLVKGALPKPSYFEIMIVFVLWEFVRRGVDYAVLETGLGGLLDGTNVVTRPDKVCIITDIGLDHPDILGDTISEISAQKAGIIQLNNHIFMYKQSAGVMQEIQYRVIKKQASLHVVEDSLRTLKAKSLQLESLPKFQLRNWGLALEAAKYVALRDDIKIDMKLNPLTILVPGRMEQRTLHDKSLLIMDGAHNKQKMTAFVESFIQLYPGERATVLFGIKEGKDYKDVIDVLLPVVDSLIITTFNTSQDLPAVSQDPVTIAKFAEENGIESVVIKDHKNAYTELVKSKARFKIITGSFYLLGQVRQNLHNK